MLVSGNADMLAYSVIADKISHEITASDGQTYRITVTYDKNSGIPDDAELVVFELFDDGSFAKAGNGSESGTSYGECIDKSAKALNRAPVNLALARAFDIFLKDPATGEELQPTGDVNVSIELLDDDLTNYASVEVVHIPDDENEKAEVMDVAVDDGAVAFATEGFSVYVLVGTDSSAVPVWMYNFKIYDTTIGTYVDYGTPQSVKNGEKPIIPHPSSDDTREFKGWYEDADTNTAEIEFVGEPFDFDNVPVFTEDGATTLYARFVDYAYVVFHDHYDAENGVWPIAYTRRAELVTAEDPDTHVETTSATIRIDDLTVNYTGGDSLAFCGWSRTPVTTPGVFRDPDTAIEYAIKSDSVTVDGTTHLYPIFRSVHWLTYYTAQSGLGAEYISSTHIFDGEGLAAPLPTPSREGYVFEGWYTGTLVTSVVDGQTVETVNYGRKVSDKFGNLSDGAIPYLNSPDGGVSVIQSKLRLSANATLYAMWSATYEVVIWKQRTTDTFDYDAANNTYEYFSSETFSANIGDTVSFDASGVSYPGYVYGYDDGPKTITNSSVPIINVYYDLSEPYTASGQTHTITFVDSEDGTGITMPEAITDVPYGTPLSDYTIATPASRKSGVYTIYTFGGWCMDPQCTVRVDLSTLTMPDRDLTLYARWSAEWFIVNIDPNYGELYYYDGGELKGTGATWFWQTYDSEPIAEYNHATRNYMPSSSGNYYYVCRDRSYYGYSGAQWDNSEKNRETYYTTNISEATEDTTFEYSPGSYSYFGWYEVFEDGTEASEPYDFTQQTTHHTTLRLLWKKNSLFYLGYDSAEGDLNDEGTKTAVLPDAYSDYARIILSRTPIAPEGYYFVGWQLRNDPSGQIYTPGQSFSLHADDAVRESGKDIVWLKAIYKRVETVTVVYDANGGTLNAGSVDFGTKPGDPPIQVYGSVDTDASTYTVTGLINNSGYTLSNGAGVTLGGRQPAGWSTSPVYNSATDTLFECGGTYGVDTIGGSTTTLYAVWPVTVTYHLNGAAGDTTADFGTPWDSATYTLSGANYTQTAYIGRDAANGAFTGRPVSEPEAIPTSDVRMFYFWTTTANDETTEYDFSRPVTGALDLYAYWSGNIAVPIHAVDASEETLTVEPTWAAADAAISVGKDPYSLTTAPTAQITPSSADYEYGFAVALDEAPTRDNVFESDAISSIYYNQVKKNIYISYVDSTRADEILEEGTELYFIYYKQIKLDISYVSMDPAGVLTPVAPPAGAPTETSLLSSYDMVQPGALGGYYCYAFAVGEENAPNASKLKLITDTSANTTPALRVENSWQGVSYSIDGGSNFIAGGYHLGLYVVYFDRQPTVVMINEKTFGTEDVMTTPFEYHIVVTQADTAGDTSSAFTVYDSDDNEGSVDVYSLQSGGSTSAILFYSDDGSTQSVQTITVTQKDTAASADFTTKVGGAETNTWSCTSTASGGTQTVVFENYHRSVAVDVHVAILGASSVTVRDDLRSADHTIEVGLGETVNFLAALPSDTLFSGDTSDYALGTIIYGNDDGNTVFAVGSETSSVTYGQISDNLYELILDGDAAKDLGTYELYYVYYHMPQIRYVKAVNGTELSAVQGSLDGNTVTDTITYNRQSILMNQATVEQDQTLFVPVNGMLVISQSGNHFRMPANLDDGVYSRYLSYRMLGVGNADVTSTDGLITGGGLDLYIRIQNNGLAYSFTGREGDFTPFTGTPTIYAVYEERGYDLMVTKTIDTSASGENPLFTEAKFTVYIESNAITKSSYEVEGFHSATIPADPDNHSITLNDVGDGFTIRIKGLGQGDYTITETQNENYVLTAKKGLIVGSSATPLSYPDLDGSTISLSLNTETKIKLTNTPKQLCKINDGGTDHIFYTFADAIDYIDNNIVDLTATVEMLSDYLVPAADALEIPYGFHVTLKSAASMDHPAVITRSQSLADAPVISSEGSFTLENVVVDGANISASAPMILSDGDLSVQTGVELINAANSGNGGAIFAMSGDVTVDGDVVISGNSASSGAAIYYTGTGTISILGGADFSGNTAASHGGAIYAAQGKIILSGTSRLENNTSSTGSGGAIYAGNAIIEIGQNARVTGNEAQSGGAIYAETATVTITKTEDVDPPVVSGNTATSGNGGAFYIKNGTVSVSGGNITGNTAASGNGGAICTDAASVTVSKTDDSVPNISGNTSQSGGAIYAQSGDVAVSGGTITNNIASSGDGGAFYAGSGGVRITGGSLNTNKANSGKGGALYAGSGAVQFSDASAEHNTAENGGAFYALSGAVTVTSGTLDANTASQSGGAICAVGGNVTVSGDSSIDGNIATSGDGGAIWTNTGALSVTGGTIDSNTASLGKGGALYSSSGKITVDGAAVTSNHSGNDGGALYAGTGAVTLTDCTAVTANTAGGNGGVICAGGVDGDTPFGGTVNLTNCTIGGTDAASANTAASGGAIYSGAGSVSVSGTTATGNSATSGDGGVICAIGGNVTLSSSQMTSNTASQSGGAVYTDAGSVGVSGTGALTNNTATGGDGGAIRSGGGVNLSGAQMSDNSAPSGNGGAFYSDDGAVTVTGSTVIGGNTASNGGAFYMANGNANLNAIAVTGNTTTSGSAIFVADGNATFAAGTVTGNTSTNGGGVGIGSPGARLYLSGNIRITGNTMGGAASNIYLDQDADDVINITGLDTNALIGIYVPDENLENRGVPGATFGAYTSTSENNITNARVKNDRHNFNIQKDTQAKKLYWGKAINVEVRYLASYSGGFPPTVAGTTKKTINNYYPTMHDAALSELSADIFNNNTLNLTASAAYGGAYLAGDTDPSNYVTWIRWDVDNAKWVVIRRDGTTEDLGTKKLLIYYAEPAYISIENNTEMPLSISELTVNGMSVINNATQGYGMLFAKNGAIRSALMPVSAEDLVFASGSSVTILIPGGQGMGYLLDGSFAADTAIDVQLRRGSGQTLADSTLAVAGDGSFLAITGTTLSTQGTYKIIFGEDKPICKVVDANGEHIFSRICDALDYIKNPANAALFENNGTTGKKATIGLLTDYLLPASDPVVIPRGYDITIQTALYDPDSTEQYWYIPSDDKAAAGESRATLSRDSENANSMISGFEGAPANDKPVDGTILRVKELIIDGKAVRGSSNGGAVSAKYCNVEVDHVDFRNVYAENGGALFVMYNYNSSNTNAAQKTIAGTWCIVRNCEFEGCNSTKAVSSRLGGGAIVTNTADFTMENCNFTSCFASDQAGAVFHRVDGNYNSNTIINNCTFTNCRAKAAGGLELDSKNITVTNCSFTNCVATDRNGGGFNVYALNSASPTVTCTVTLEGCSFENCQAKNFGGGFRSTATDTKVMNCSFTNTAAKDGDGSGGAIGISSANAKKAEIYACTITGASATKVGGGIYYAGKELVLGDTYTSIIDGEEHTGTMSINNCKAANQGGGIYHNKDGVLTITNASINGNTSTNNAGGGVYTNAKTVTLTGSSVTNNTSKLQGGGIYQDKDVDGTTFTMTDTVVNGNTNTDTNNGKGGGVYTKARTVLITGGEISNNKAPNNGGGLYSNALVSLTMRGTTVSGNTSTSKSGGGIYYDSDNATAATADTQRNSMRLTLEGCTIDSNSGNYGGGVFTQVNNVSVGDYTYTDDAGEHVMHSSISHNTAKLNGGGLYHNRDAASTSLTITNATIDGNRITGSATGGGVYTTVRTVAITGGSISNNTATSSGGGLWYDSTKGSNADGLANRLLMSLSIDGTKIDGNTAGSSGGGVFTQVRTVSVSNGASISDNVSTASGGGLYHNTNIKVNNANNYLEGSSLTITDSAVDGNRANSGHGGGILSNSATITITNSSLSNNTTSSNGGALHYDRMENRSEMTLAISGSTLSGNTAGANGGAVSSGAYSLSVTDNSVFSDNTAGKSGGGIYHRIDETSGYDASFTVVTDSTIENCRANGTSEGGGGILSNTARLTMTGVTVDGNTSAAKGGGILYTYSRSFDVTDANAGGLKLDGCSVIGNTAAVGGGIHSKSYVWMLHGSEVTGNRLSTSRADDAAGIYLVDGITLVGGVEGIPISENDTIIIRDNHTNAGNPSNLRLWSNSDLQNNKDSVYIFCNLSSASEVRVVNANKVGTQFGSSAIENPLGFTQGFTEDFSVFRSDYDTLHGVIDRSNSNFQNIIWAGPAICKITDANGNLLYIRRNNEGHGADPAIFDRLDNGVETDTGITSAFSLLRDPELVMYYADGSEYYGPDYIVKMLDSFTTDSPVIINCYEGQSGVRNITLTTASRDPSVEGEYYYEYSKRVKTKSNVATVTCGTGVGNATLFHTNANFTFSNIVIDGGSLNGIPAQSKTRILYVDNDNIEVKLLGGAILQNASINGNGGAVNVNSGKFIIGDDRTGGAIKNCRATNGGAVYSNGSEVVFNRGNIFQCEATTGSGGGVYVANGVFNMYGGSVERCQAAASGGGVYVVNGMTFRMSGTSSRIAGNHAVTKGGGVAVGGANTRLYFSVMPVITGNTCDASVATHNTSNLELDYDSNAVINTESVTYNGREYHGLINGAYIGVYVPGTESTNSNYDIHGVERTPFGTYAEHDPQKTFYCFVNDRNGLKGGLIGGIANNYIYWVKIFSLEVSVHGTGIPDGERFKIEVNLVDGDEMMPGQLSAREIDGEFGSMTFHSDSASATSVIMLELGENGTWEDGVNCIGENLSYGLRYTVKLVPEGDQGIKYAVLPILYTGMIGENNKEEVDVPESERYISRAPFEIVPAICKLTDWDGNLLYYKYEPNYSTPTATPVDANIPAVFPSVQQALDALNSPLYSGVNINSPTYTVGQNAGVQIQMLIENHTLPAAISLPANVPVTLTTASSVDAQYPYRGSPNTLTTITRGFESDSMFTANGAFTVSAITLDGAKGAYAPEVNGGIVNVVSGGSLTLAGSATLRNSKVSGNGGAVYVAQNASFTMPDGTVLNNEAQYGGAVYVSSGASMAMSGGTVTNNRITRTGGNGDGAGIYLSAGGRLNLSGSPNFGMSTNNTGTISTTQGNLAGTLTARTNGGKTYGVEHQDIFLEESAGDPASLVLKSNLTGNDGSIWIWANNSNRYAMASPFAKIDFAGEVTDDTYRIFRNAQIDTRTFVSDGKYLTGDEKREKDGFVHWTGGFDVYFEKIDGFGTALAGATFTLYTDAACTTAFQRNGAPVTAISADGTAAYQNAASQTLPEGTVLLAKLPAGVYYMKETTPPNGYVNSLPDASGASVPNVYVILLGEAELAKYADYGLSADAITAQTAMYQTKFSAYNVKGDYAIFLLDGDSQSATYGNALTVPSVAEFGVMNISVYDREVILKKCEDSFEPLPGAQFDILRYDLTTVATETVSGDAGVFWVSDLPYGTYYLHETLVPNGFDKLASNDNWYRISVTETGVTKPARLPSKP